MQDIGKRGGKAENTCCGGRPRAPTAKERSYNTYCVLYVFVYSRVDGRCVYLLFRPLTDAGHNLSGTFGGQPEKQKQEAVTEKLIRSKCVWIALICLGLSPRILNFHVKFEAVWNLVSARTIQRTTVVQQS